MKAALKGRIFSARLALGLAAVFAVAAGRAPVLAQTYPDKPINVVVPWPPGALDVYIRFVQPYAEKMLGKPLLIINRGGANGVIGTEYVRTSKPDGYTLLFNVTSSAVMAPLTTDSAKFDIRRDFVAVSDFLESLSLLVVRKDFPARNLQEFIDYARSNQGKLNFGSPGAGSALHINAETFARAIGVNMTHIAYRGYAPEVQALVGGELDMAFISAGTIRTQVLNGSVRALATCYGEPPPDMPQVPDVRKSVPGYVPIPVLSILWAPAGTPPDIVERLNKVMAGAIRLPEVRSKLGEGGQIVLGRSVAEANKAVADNYEIASKHISDLRAAGVKFE